MTSNYLKKKKRKEKNLEVRIYRQDIRMEFGIEKYALLILKSGKRRLTDGMELASQHKIRTLGEKETYTYMGILVADTIKQVEMKEKNKKEYLRRTWKLLETIFQAYLTPKLSL